VRSPGGRHPERIGREEEGESKRERERERKMSENCTGCKGGL